MLALWWMSYWRLDTVGFTRRRWDANPHAKVAYHSEITSEIGCAQGLIFLSIEGGTGGVVMGPWMGRELSAWPEGIMLWYRHYDMAYSREELHRVSLTYREHTVFVCSAGTFAIPHDREFTSPAWLISMPFFLAPLIRAILLTRQLRRRRQGHCGNCGYSLTGNVSGVCPECGTPVAPQYAQAKA